MTMADPGAGADQDAVPAAAPAAEPAAEGGELATMPLDVACEAAAPPEPSASSPGEEHFATPKSSAAEKEEALAADQAPAEPDGGVEVCLFHSGRVESTYHSVSYLGCLSARRGVGKQLWRSQILRGKRFPRWMPPSCDSKNGSQLRTGGLAPKPD